MYQYLPNHLAYPYRVKGGEEWWRVRFLSSRHNLLHIKLIHHIREEWRDFHSSHSFFFDDAKIVQTSAAFLFAKIQNRRVSLQVFPVTGNVSGKNREKIGGNREICREKQENRTKKQKTSTYQKCCLQYIYITLIWPLESKTGKDITVDVAFIVSLSDGELSRVTIFIASVKL